MRTVKLTIEVEVPDEAEWITVDQLGSIRASTVNNEPIESEISFRNYTYKEEVELLFVKNWRDLKINLREYFAQPCEQCGAKWSHENEVTFGVDPYQSEINGDYTKVWLCDNCRDINCDEI